MSKTLHLHLDKNKKYIFKKCTVFRKSIEYKTCITYATKRGVWGL